MHAHGAADAADEGGLGDLGNGFERVLDLVGETAEREVVVGRAGEGERENGDIVDGAGLDQRGGDAGREAVEVGLEALVEADEGGLDLGADLVADDDGAEAGARGGVEVFDAGDFPEEFFEGAGETILDLGGRRTGKGAENVDHRDVDLRLFLPGEHQDREHPEENRREDDDGREFRRGKDGGEAAGEAVARARSGGRGRRGVGGTHG